MENIQRQAARKSQETKTKCDLISKIKKGLWLSSSGLDPVSEPFFWIRVKYDTVWRKPDCCWWFDVWDLSITLRFSTPLLCCVHGCSSSPPPPPPVKRDSWQTRPCLPVTLHPRWPEPDQQPVKWGQCQGQGRCFCWELGWEGGEVAGAIKMAPLMIIIHCLLFLLSSTLAPTPPAFLSSSCRGGGGGAARASAEPRMLGVNGVRWQTPG